MEYRIKILNGEELSIKAEPTDTILHVKELLSEVTGQPLKFHSLIYKGMLLVDEFTLDDLSISPEDKIHAVVKVEIPKEEKPNFPSALREQLKEKMKEFDRAIIDRYLNKIREECPDEAMYLNDTDTIMEILERQADPKLQDMESQTMDRNFAWCETNPEGFRYLVERHQILEKIKNSLNKHDPRLNIFSDTVIIENNDDIPSNKELPNPFRLKKKENAFVSLFKASASFSENFRIEIDCFNDKSDQEDAHEDNNNLLRKLFSRHREDHNSDNEDDLN